MATVSLLFLSLFGGIAAIAATRSGAPPWVGWAVVASLAVSFVLARGKVAAIVRWEARRSPDPSLDGVFCLPSLEILLSFASVFA